MPKDITNHYRPEVLDHYRLTVAKHLNLITPRKRNVYFEYRVSINLLLSNFENK